MIKNLFISGVVALTACKPTTSANKLQGFLDNNADASLNHLVAFVGDDNGIPGVLQDPPNLAKVFNTQNGFNITFHGPKGGSTSPQTLRDEDIGYRFLSAKEMAKVVGDVARQMLITDKAAQDAGNPGGTLFFYMTSHGAEDGSTSVDGGSDDITFDVIANAIKDARGGVPLQRLVVMFDTCFSGMNKEVVLNQDPNVGDMALTPFSGFGLNPTIPSTPSVPGSPGAVSSFINKTSQQFSSVKGVYHSAIFIAASRPDETSGDDPDGGVGTKAFLMAVNEARNGYVSPQNSAAKLNQLGVKVNASLGNNIFGSPSTTGVKQGTVPSEMTITAVMQRMISYAEGQTPGACWDPPEIGTQKFLDPPGVKTVLDPNLSAAVRKTTPQCIGGISGTDGSSSSDDEEEEDY